MAQTTSGRLRVLERLAQVLQGYLDRLPEEPEVPRRTEPAPLPEGLRAAEARLARLEEAVARTRQNAAGVEQLLLGEADALAAWVETFVRIKARLAAWADEGKPPAGPSGDGA